MSETESTSSDPQPEQPAAVSADSRVEITNEDDTDDGDVLSAFVLSFESPVSAGEPCGESVRYESDFERIKDEIDKLSDIDFTLVADLASKLLVENTKDLLVASYLAFALTKTRGLEGMADGVAVLHLLGTTFWENIFPRKIPARQAALKFFAEKVSGSLEGYKPREDEREIVGTAIARLKIFQSFITETMGESAPPFSTLVRVLADIERKLPKPKVVAPQAGSSDAGSSGGGASPAEITTPSDAASAVRKGIDFFRTQNLSNPSPYRLLRALRWSAIVVEPPNENGKTRIPAPIEQRRTYLSGLLQAGDAKKVVADVEASFQEGSFHFWFDLQRLIAAALDALGSEYEAAKQAILEETALVLNRVPSLKDLAFADGTPFVGPLCSEWIASDVETILSSGDSSAAEGASSISGDEQLEDQKREAQKALMKGDLSAAIRIMREGGDLDRSAKDRFLRQMHLADLCMKGKRPTIARPILENLDQAIEKHGLPSWDPDLALAVWSALHQCYKVVAAKAPTGEKAALVKSESEIFEKICRIDAAYALTLS